MKAKVVDISKLAVIIAEHVTNIEDVCFESFQPGSLCDIIAKKRKKNCDKSFRNYLQTIWNKGELRNELKHLLGQTDKVIEPEHETETLNDNSSLISDLKPSDNLIKSKKKTDFEIIRMKGDGNCLFRALSYAVNGTQDLHARMRKKIVQYVVENFEELSVTLNASCVDFEYRYPEQYMSVMGTDKEFGTDFEMGIFSKMYKRNILIWKKVEDSFVYKSKVTLEEEEEGETVNILFSGKERSGHFNFLKIPKENKDPVKFSPHHFSVYDFYDTEDFLMEKTYKFEAGSDFNLGNGDKTKNDDSLPINDSKSPDSPRSFIQNLSKFSSRESLSITQINDSLDEEDVNASKHKESLVLSNNNENNNKTSINKQKKTKKRRRIYVNGHGSFRAITQQISTQFDYIDICLIKNIILDGMEKYFRCSCPLSFYSDKRRNLDFWVMYARCAVESHGAKFRFDIFELDDNYIEIYVSSNTILPFQHEEGSEVPPRQIRSKNRQEMFKLLKYRSVRSVQLEEMQKCDREILADGGLGKHLYKLSTLYKIKSEHNVAQRKILKSRDMSDVMQSYIDDSKTSDPFIRHVSLPLQILLYTREQLYTINENKPVILHLDSTGANVYRPDFMKNAKIFYYCLIYRATKAAIPLAQMITSEHDITSISTFLMKYKTFVRKELHLWPFAKAIVTDWSWALMNSFMYQWNDMKVTPYLKLCFEYVNTNKFKPGVTILLSCCAHTIHRVSKTIKKDFQELINIKSFLLECIVLLILCRNYKEMKTLFYLILNIILRKDKDLINDYLQEIGSKITLHKTNSTHLILESEELEKQNPKLIEEKKDSIYLNSPFYQDFRFLLDSTRRNIENREGDIEITNKYYAPKFAEFFTSKYMPYCAIWSGLMLDLVDPNISRVSNAYVESHNRFYKELVLKGRKLNFIGDVVRALRENNNYLVAEEEIDNLRPKGRIERDRPLYPEAASNPFETEKWGRKKKDMKKKRFAHMEVKTLKRISSKLNANKTNTTDKNVEDSKIVENENNTCIKRIKLDHENFSNVELLDNEIVEQLDNRVTKAIGNSDVELNNNTLAKSEETFNNGLKGSSINNDVKLLDNSLECLQIELLENGLVKPDEAHKNYYLLSNSSKIKVSSYAGTKKCVLNEFRKLQLTASNFKCLASPNSWIDGQIIDAYVACNVEEWMNITYFPTDSTTVIGNDWESRYHKGRSYMKIKDKLNEILLLPYSFHGHWRLLVVQLNTKEITLMDPYEDTTDSERVIKAFSRYIKNCDQESTLSQFRHIKWTITECKKRPYQNSSDSSNCGLYLIHYIMSIAKKSKEQFDIANCFDSLEFNPITFRDKVKDILLRKSENVRQNCLHCLGTIKKNAMLCAICKRYIHPCCIKNNQTDSDDEWKSTKKTPLIEKFSVCRLCAKHST